ncbi:MAG TPA: helix-turn-helix transcriptional regulator [Noviherbaspirillum sp.]|nr:helix-turn-helix transcriptional regulator [Noviherbaspirillum sp.]
MPGSLPARTLTAQREFGENLRMLCSYYRSVADVCRKLNINRAQFNRYLNGTSRPSNHTLERICEFFGVEPSEIHLPHQQFRQVVQVHPRQRSEHLAYVDHIARLQQQPSARNDKYLGYYYEYYHSMSAPGKVLRGLVRIFLHEGAVYHERLERFPQHANLDQTYRCKYLGATFFLNDRIFLTDYESLSGNEIAHTVLYPTYKNRVARLSGLMLGVSASNQRAIACTRVVFEFLGKSIDVRAALRRCGLFDPAEGAVDRTILKVIDNSAHKDRHHFYTIPL